MAGLSKRVGRIGFIGIQSALIILCALLLTLSYQFDSTKRQNQLKAAQDIVELNSGIVDSLFVRMSMLTDIITSSNNNYVDMLAELPANRVEAYKLYTSFKERFDGELNIIFTGVTDKYIALWLLPRELEMSGMFAFPLLSSEETDFSPRISGTSVIGHLENYSSLHFVTDGPGPNETRYVNIESQPDAVYAVSRLNVRRVSKDSKFRVNSYDLGLLILGTDFGGIFDQISNTGLLSNTKYFLVNRNSELLASSDHSTDHEAYDLDLPAGTKVGRYLVYRNELSNGLRMITLLEAESYLNQNRSQLYLYVSMTLLIVILGLFISRYLSGAFVQPIMVLTEHISDTDRVQIPEGVYSAYRSEIKKLFTTYNDQTKRIDALIENLRSQQKREQMIELRLLQTQINPHFIYNTFDTICYRELMRGEDDVAGILDNVSSIMRYGISQPGMLAPLRCELDILKRYLDIENSCYDMPIISHIEVDEACMDAYVPKLILQPLVENALLHGRTTIDKEIRIHITAQASNGVLQVTVVDSGTCADIDRMNEGLCMGIESLMARTSGLGALNVHLRIQRRFGEEYGVHYTKTDTGNTCAVLTLPMQYNETA
jgi:two-component system sensor histidine kinase YesM